MPTSTVTLAQSEPVQMSLHAESRTLRRGPTSQTPPVPLGHHQTSMNERRRQVHHEADVVVVGAGIFGCTAAYMFAKQGRSVILLERSMKEPDRIVGELLQPGGCAALEQLGLRDCLEGIDAIRVEGYQIIYHGVPVTIPYPPDLAESLTGGFYNDKYTGPGQKPEGRSFHHGRLISRLREACKSSPNITIFETDVTETLHSSDASPVVLGVQAKTKDASTGEVHSDVFFGTLTLAADGYNSRFRKHHIGTTPVANSKFWALELIDCPMPVRNYGHVIIGALQPILVYQIGTHETRALIDIPNNLPAASAANGGVKGYIRNIVIPTLPEAIRPCFITALESGKALRSMPNSWLPPSTQQKPGLLILGDAMNMRHPLTGGGMTVAFNDVVLLSTLLSPEQIPSLSDTQAVQRAMRRFHWQRKSLSSVINVLAQALYSLFAAAGDPHLQALQKGTFRYLCMGGARQGVPVSMLGGIIRNPALLVYHFFSVAFYSIALMWSDSLRSLTDVWKILLLPFQSFMVFYTACVVIGPYIISELRS